MKKDTIAINKISVPLYSVNTLIIGSGTASLNTAVTLFESGQKDIAVVTDNWGGGTSNNAGSDKQTYYKVSLSGKTPDSTYEMAKDLFNGSCMHGDIALCEAHHSAEAFYNLVRLGVSFPYNRYGAYVGYKTDHDPKGRGTSAGPLTSHLMFKALSKYIRNKKIKVFDRYEIIALLTQKEKRNTKIIGAVALDKKNLESKNFGFVVFNAVNVVLGTGGPAGIYKTSVYPVSQIGSHGLALKIGATAHNLTESQFGIASIKFRWNLSGSYQQVIPRYISTDQDGKNEQEFLTDYFPTMRELATAIFLKGYQWPFDSGKVAGYGSSLIDILVHQEKVIKGRRVFLDFGRNPGGCGKLKDFSFNQLSDEAFDYLKKSGALLDTPIKRLKKINKPAIELYRSKGIDIEKEYLEIAVCAQHNNGGLKGNIWWESNIRHLFPVGEVNGTHGVKRPGGSSLNAGQVGSMRAALFIANRYNEKPINTRDFGKIVKEQVEDLFLYSRKILDKNIRNSSNQKLRENIQNRMSNYAAHIRDPQNITTSVKAAKSLYKRMLNETKIPSQKFLPFAFKNLDLCLTHIFYLEAINEYIKQGGESRGSFLILNSNGKKPCKELNDEWKFSVINNDMYISNKILELTLSKDGRILKNWTDIRPIPDDDSWFENVWNDYMNDKIIQ
ncbi:FAD-binding protein [Bacteroidota bacterium]